MSDEGPHGLLSTLRVTDARGRRVTQLDPVAMDLLHCHNVIPPKDLRTIATAIDPKEVKRRSRVALLTPAWIALWYAAFFGYFYIFERWRGWNPVLVMLATFYFVYPIAMLFYGSIKARRARRTRIQRFVLEHCCCPHCGYNLHGCPSDPHDDATFCPECGCAWSLPGPSTDQPTAS